MIDHGYEIDYLQCNKRIALDNSGITYDVFEPGVNCKYMRFLGKPGVAHHVEIIFEDGSIMCVYDIAKIKRNSEGRS